MSTAQEGLLASSAIAIGILPLIRAARLEAPSRTVLGVALAFAVSFSADVTDLAIGPGLMSQVYLVGQVGLLLWALRPTRVIVPTLLVAGVTLWSAALRDGVGVDVVEHAMAFATMAWAAYTADRLEREVRSVLVVGFAGLAIAWALYASHRAFWSWGVYQGVRAVLAVAWCVAVTRAASTERAAS